MSFDFLEESMAVLSRTPATLNALLRDLPETWTTVTEGGATWSPYSVMGHLVHGEHADWMPRLTIILEHGETRAFDTFDREFRPSGQRSLASLLDEFRDLREENLRRLRALNLGEPQLALRGKHPVLGTVTTRQLLATWVGHDLTHIVQITRTMAKRYREEVGPWAQFLTVMR